MPDYRGGSILNLVQSIAEACAAQGLPPYAPLAALPPARIAEARHVILLVADGLGVAMLDRHPAAPTLRGAQLATLTSVFPSTTASAIPSFMSGLAPAAHGLCGWHMHLEEVGRTLAILPLTPRDEPGSVGGADLPQRLFDYPTLYQRLARPSYVLAPRGIAGSPFNTWHTRGATAIAYDGLDELGERIVDLVDSASEPSFIYAYYGEYDRLAHDHGCASAPARAEIERIDAAFGGLVERLAGRGALLMLTADHGFIDSPTEHLIDLDHHPHFGALLARPLCGERRVAYAWVDAGRQAEFVAYANENFAEAIDLQRSEDVLGAGLFGPPPYHPRLRSRLGDFTLLMRDDWTIKDWLPGEKRHAMIGVHGGLSAAEMQVPLIVHQP